ncbi:MAG: diguanylate cyclase with and sensor, partial [Frankiales bacterium]|nr:diguanylate cyclase with and sensor [Frankiales bacterium]
MTAGGALLPFVRPGVSSFLIDVAKRVGASLDLAKTLEQITTGVVELLGFQVAVLNLITPDGDLEVVAVAGPAQSLLGARDSRANWDTILGLGEQRGGLRFVPHTTTGWPEGPSWTPDLPPSQLTNAWHPEDALFAPLIGM